MLHSHPEAQPGLWLGGGGRLKMEKIVTSFWWRILGDVIWWRLQNDVIIDILEVLLRYN